MLSETASLLIRLVLKDETTPTVAKTEKAFQKLGGTISKAGTDLTKGLTLPLVGAGIAAFKFASDVEEASSRAKTVYGDAADGIVAASKNMDDAFD